MCLGGQATDADGDAVQALFTAVGKMFRVPLRAHLSYQVSPQKNVGKPLACLL